MDAQELWDTALPLLELQVRGPYRAILAQLSPLSFVDGTLTLGVPNSTLREMIQRNCLESMVECLCEFAETEVTVTFTDGPIRPLAQQTDTYQPAVIAAPKRPQQNYADTGLLDYLTFETFVRVDCNDEALTIGQQTVEALGRRYNPLYILGKSGTGKTHLMQAIANRARTNDPQVRILYVSAAQFCKDVKAAWDAKTSVGQTIQDVDVWMVDDIGLIAEIKGGGSAFEREFFDTLNAMLMMPGKQIIIASESSPVELKIANERLSSRLEHGIFAELNPPRYEARLEILWWKARQMDYEAELREYAWAVEEVAKQVVPNIRSLEGALTDLCGKRSIHGCLTPEIVERVIGRRRKSEDRDGASMMGIVKYVGEQMQCSVDLITGPKRTKDVSWPRQVAIYLVQELTDHSLTEIGTFFGNRDHTTVISSRNKVAGILAEDESVLRQINAMKAALRGA